jgi:hypothetical protein
LTYRFVDLNLERPRIRVNLAYQVSNRLQVGLEWNPDASEVNPTLNYTLAFETERMPMVNFGTSSDRIGTPKGPRSYFVTFAKTFDSRVVPYFSINYSEFEDGWNFPFGMNIFLDKHWVLLPMHDGRKSHLLLTYRGERFSASALWVWYRHPGVSVSWNF